MMRALREYVVVGIQTNIPFHLELLADERFRKGEFDTGFLEREFTMPAPDGHPDEQAALLVAAVLTHLKRRRPLALESGRGDGSGWRSAARERSLASRTTRQGWRRTS
jgi:acetyl-CoA carboxylase biotin carboxylase subunit